MCTYVSVDSVGNDERSLAKWPHRARATRIENVLCTNHFPPILHTAHGTLNKHTHTNILHLL